VQQARRARLLPTRAPSILRSLAGRAFVLKFMLQL
jgi:hypothetical protein